MGIALVRFKCFKNQIIYISTSDILTTRVIIDPRHERSILLVFEFSNPAKIGEKKKCARQVVGEST